ncbi:MAG: cyclic pyranopterin monophosphate synthase MoaC [Phycisphaerae bacterium]
MPRRIARPRLTHLDAAGRARMVDVSAKRPTHRRAVAAARVRMKPETLAALLAGRMPKGDVRAVARLAGIQAAKRTSELIPLCHPLALDAVAVDLVPEPPDAVQIVATARVRGPTGVEMEALVAAAIAALALYDMCKGVERGIEIESLRLEEKSGGRSGLWRRACGRRPAGRGRSLRKR